MTDEKAATEADLRLVFTALTERLTEVLVTVSTIRLFLQDAGVFSGEAFEARYAAELKHWQRAHGVRLSEQAETSLADTLRRLLESTTGTVQ